MIFIYCDLVVKTSVKHSSLALKELNLTCLKPDDCEGSESQTQYAQKAYMLLGNIPKQRGIRI